MNGNKSVTTNYTQNHYSLTVNVSGNGLVTMTPPQSAYNYGDAVQLFAVPDVSWIFDGWSGDLSGVMNPESMTIDGDKTVTAIFIECFSLTLSHTGNGTMPLVEPAQSAGCPAGRYVEGEVISLSGAVPDVGWLIDGWTGTDHDTDKANTNTVTMPANAHTVFVNYVEMITPVLLSPDGTIDGVSRPDFEWRVYPDATAYRLAVYSYSAAAYLILDVAPLSNCNASQCSYPSPIVLVNGAYKFKVLAYIPGGVTPYTDWMDFTITGVSVPPPPDPPVPISPSGTVTSHHPTLTWGAVEYATFYRLALYSNAAGAYLFVENVYPSCAAGECSYTPNIDLVNGNYKFKLLARNSSGYTAYGNFMSFTVSSNLPVAPALLAPSGTVSTNKPQIKWSVVSGATRYRLAVYSNATRSYVILTYVYPGACSGGVCSYIPPSALPTGGYKFKLLTINSYGMSNYSEWMPFTIP